jgi:leader peptidase (prepilin peptidase)/N-methyltransferase
MVAAAVFGVAARWWLRKLAYRLPDERDLPAPSHWWVVVVTPLLVGLVAWGLAGRWPWWVVVAGGAFTALWLAASAIDLDVNRLPDRFTLPVAALAAVCVIAAGFAGGGWQAPGQAVSAAGLAGGWEATWRALACGVLLAGAHAALAFLFWLIPPHRAGLGAGDVKLALSLGVVTGWFSWSCAVASFLATFFVGAVWAVVLLVGRRVRLRGVFAFGPSMVVGTALALALIA